MAADQVFAGRDARLPAGRWDVLVVGAGIYGLPVAFFLARHHRARVLVIEDNTIPGECITVNTGGIIRIAYSDLDVVRVAGFAREIYRNPTARLGVARPVHLGFVPTRWGRFVNEDAVPGILAEVTRIARGTGGRLRVVPMADYVQALPPARRATLGRIMDLDDCTHVLVDDDGGFCDGGTALTGLYEACLDAGVCFSLYSSVREFVREGGRITGVVLERWSRRGEAREIVARETVSADRIVLAGGRGNGALVRRAAGWEMPTFTSFHQVPFIRNSPDNDFAQTRYRVGPPGAGRRFETDVEMIDAPTISHWRDVYFRPEGSGLIFGTHHHLLQDDDYEPAGGTIDGVRVGLDQVMIDTLLEVMPHFPALASQGVNLGRTPADIAGGAYYMNPEELPFEGEVPGTGGTVFYAGSGCGTGFKLGPGVAWLLVERLAGVPPADRLIASPALSAERATYFYPPGTSREELLRQFRPVAEGGRLVDMGAAGIAVARG
ncbi:MAG: FAD-binding oxidoreductase [Candidatus Rokubacteria bacterium]|nr:FAD-binding oxidoreductase [Candidatus Rokubacteria bacterium]